MKKLLFLLSTICLQLPSQGAELTGTFLYGAVKISFNVLTIFVAKKVAKKTAEAVKEITGSETLETLAQAASNMGVSSVAKDCSKEVVDTAKMVIAGREPIVLLEACGSLEKYAEIVALAAYKFGNWIPGLP